MLIEVETAGGPVRNHFVPSAAEVPLDTGDRVVGPVSCDVQRQACRPTGIPFLTDNASPKIAARNLSLLRGVVVYDSLDLLVLLYRGSELRVAVEDFMSDTSVIFSRERLRGAGVEL